MKKKIIAILFLGIISFSVVSCSMGPDTAVYKAGAYKMIEVPVLPGGITFPIGIDDDNTATLNNIYYLGEKEVTFGLWQAIAAWGTFDKNGEEYDYIYWDPHPYLTSDMANYPVCGVTYLQALVWCNAYTEWYNAKHGTHYTAVYTDEIGDPIRSAKKPFPPNQYSFNELNTYLNDTPAMKNYLLNIQTSGTGFRLPTPNEWELAARWRGTDNTNTVLDTINGIDFIGQTIKFTKGNSASGATASISDLNESHLYAVFEYNSNGNLFLPGTKKPNALNIYDMSGNLREYVYEVEYINLRGDTYPFAQTRGGYYEDIYESIAIGGSIYVDVCAYNYYYGLRLARNR